MIIKFSNLGAIKETELDLRPLTIIIGPNNSNKTYISYSVYGLWQHFREDLRFKSTWEKFDNYVDQRGDNEYSLKVTDDLLDLLIVNYKRELKIFKKNLGTFFQDSSSKLFLKTSFEINLTKQEVKDALNRLVKQKKINYPRRGSLILSLNRDILNIMGKWKVSESESYQPSKFFFAYLVLYALTDRLFQEPYLLPAERNAFIITYKMLANSRLKFLKQTQRELFNKGESNQKQIELFREQGDIRYPTPIEDFLEFLSDIELEEDLTQGRTHKNEFQKLADIIEQSIQNKNTTNLNPTRFSKEIKINVKKGLDIDLYNASSSIKQLAPLLLYLRYRASDNDLLIIDEPEMNLHPESQAKLLEVLAILVNLGVKVLITTHSPYFMAHLNNLVNGNTKNKRILQKQALTLYLKDPRAFLPINDVSAYEMREFKLHNLKDENYGIRWDTLSDVSAQLQQKYFQIYEKGKPAPRAKKKSQPRKKAAA